MAVITLAEYKALKGITDTTQDTLISTFIPLVQDDIVQACNYSFGFDTDAEDFPASLKLIAAQMITYQMSAQKGSSVYQSENIEGYSYTRAAVGGSGYPETIEKALEKHKRARVVITQAQTQYRDRRQHTPSMLSNVPAKYNVPGVAE